MINKIMKLIELKDPLDTIQYHTELNPALWENNELRPEVHAALMKIAETFLGFLEVPDLQVEDVVITGRNAGYNWTALRDIDLHLIVDFDTYRDTCPALLQDYFDSKKRIWNDARDIKIRGFDVELYVEDRKEPAVTQGEYSLLRDGWLKKPRYNPPSVDDRAVRKKVAHFVHIIDKLPPCKNPEMIEQLKNKVWGMRKAGLAQGGEGRVENIAFKILRNTGYIDKLIRCHGNAIDHELSLE